MNYEVTYQMSKNMFNALVATRKGKDKNTNPHDYVCQVVEDTFGIRGKCIKVTIKG